MPLRLALAITVGISVHYTLTVFPGAGPTLDSLEFQTAVSVMGVVHPPGSPLYLLLGRLFTLVLPAGDIALRLNLFSAIAASLAVGILYLLVVRLTGNRLAAVLAALLLALSPQFWYQAIIAEVWSLNAVLLGAVLLLWLLWIDTGSRDWFWMGLVLFALSLGNHGSMILLLPALLVSGLSAMRVRASNNKRAHSHVKAHSPVLGATPAEPVPEDGDRSIRDDGSILISEYIFHIVALVALMAPLVALPYLYVPLRTPHAVFCNYCPDRGAGLLAYFTAYPFRGALLGVPAEALLGRLVATGVRLVQQFGWAGAGLGVMGIWRLARPDRSSRPFGQLRASSVRSAGVFLFMALAAEAVFALTYDVPDWPEFLSPSFFIFALLVGIGAGAAIEWTLARTGRLGLRNLARWGFVVGAACLLALQGLLGYKQIQALRDPFLRDWSAGFLQVIEPGAWVLMPPVGTSGFLQAWALRYRAWAVPGAPTLTLVAPPGFSPPGPPPGYLMWEAARSGLSDHTVYALTLDDPRLAGVGSTPVHGPGGDVLAYRVLWPSR